MTKERLAEIRHWVDFERSLTDGPLPGNVLTCIEFLTYIDALRSQLAVVEKERDEAVPTLVTILSTPLSAFGGKSAQKKPFGKLAKRIFSRGAEFGRKQMLEAILKKLRSEGAQYETWVISGNAWADWLEARIQRIEGKK